MSNKHFGQLQRKFVVMASDYYVAEKQIKQWCSELFWNVISIENHTSGYITVLNHPQNS